MDSSGAALIGAQRPRVWTAPDRHRELTEGCSSCGDPEYKGAGCGNYLATDVLDWAQGFGYQLDDWQKWVLTEGLGTAPDGRWSSFENAVIVSRQNGKGTCEEVRELSGLFVIGEELIIHTAHEMKALDVATDVLTANRGWTTMGALTSADLVYAPDGTPTSLIAHQWRTGRPCYKLAFADGQEIVADAEHLWDVTEARGNKAERKIVTTEAMFLQGCACGSRGYRWHVAFPAPVPGSPLDTQELRVSRSAYNAIVSITPVETRPTRCITVSHPSGCYLVGRGFTVTHNTAMEHFRRVCSTIENYDALRRRLKGRPTQSHGFESIELLPAPTLIFGSGRKRIRRKLAPRLRILARSRSSSRGFSCDCFSGDTRYWTRDGLKTLAETSGSVQEVLVSAGSGYGGAWRKAEIRSFGERRLWAVTLRRNKVTKVIRATAGHRWLVRDSRTGFPDRVIETQELHAGHKLAWRLPKSRLKNSALSQFGVAHGIAFGDGSRTQHGAEVQLWGDKDRQLLKYFTESRQVPVRTSAGVDGVRVSGLPLFFKDRPSLDESVPYLYGWLAGYFAADGNVAEGRIPTLHSADRGNLEFVQLLAARLGIGTYGINSRVRQGYGEPSRIHSVQFVSSTLRPKFFLITEHRERYEAGQAEVSRNERLGWTVVSAELTAEVEEVFCAVVPEHENFVLEDWINVKNCLIYDEAMILSAAEVGASFPTMSARSNPQIWYGASAGLPDSDQLSSVYRRILRDDKTLFGAVWAARLHTAVCPRDERRGRSSNDYVVGCAEHDDRDDPRTWAKANPAFGIRLREAFTRSELNAMPPVEFDRERLGVGQWPSEEETWAVIPEETWKALAVNDAGGTTPPIAFAVDVAEDGEAATIGAAWLHRGGKIVIEVPRNCSRPGTTWVVPRLQELVKAWKPQVIVVPKNGPAAGLGDDIEKLFPDEVLRAGSTDEAAAFAWFTQQLKSADKPLMHFGKVKAAKLWKSVGSAETRVVGDGGKMWSRRDSDCDITPVVTVTLASWGLNKKRRGYDPLKSIG